MEQHAGDFSELSDRIVAIDPRLPGQQIAFRAFCNLLTRLVRATDETNRHGALQQAREEIESIGGVAASRSDVGLKFACSVIVDVVAQGWELDITEDRILLRSPRTERVSHEELKRRIR